MGEWYPGRQPSLSRVYVLSNLKKIVATFLPSFYAVPLLLRVFDTRRIVPYQMQRLTEMRKASFLFLLLYVLYRYSSFFVDISAGCFFVYLYYLLPLSPLFRLGLSKLSQ